MKKLLIILCFFCCLLGVSFQSNNTFVDASKNNNEVLEKSNIRFNKKETSISDDFVSVIESLNSQIEDFNELLLSSNDEDEKNKLRVLIDTTQELINNYLVIQNQQATPYYVPVDPSDMETLRFMGYVTEAIALYRKMGYYLSAELLTYAYHNDNPDIYYEPVYINRALSSQVTYDIAYGNKISENEVVFPMSGCRNELDMYFSIRTFSYTKPSKDSKKFYLKDKYDFTKDDLDGSILENIVQFATNVFANIQAKGIIVPFYLNCEIDVNEPIMINSATKSDSGWKVEVTNNTSKYQRVIYNKKLCFDYDARNWTDLKDIDYFEINPNSSKTIDIYGNGTASYVAVSYIKDNERVVTLADCVNNLDNLEMFKTKYYSYDNISIIGKDNNIWIIELTNNYDFGRTIEYNTKMCNESDAKNWDNLFDLKTRYFCVGESIILRIQENYAASFIAIRTFSDTLEEKIYANNLNEKGTMDVYREEKKVYTYLQLMNSGKDGKKWNICVTNMVNEEIVVQYNAKMCFDDDAKYWRNLNDIREITINNYGSRIITIEENWFATTIAVSYCTPDKRLITYAKNLSTDGSIYIMEQYLDI